MSESLQTKCKTLFGGPRLVFDQNISSKKQYGFFNILAYTPPPPYGKRPYFSDFRSKRRFHTALEYDYC